MSDKLIKLKIIDHDGKQKNKIMYKQQKKPKIQIIYNLKNIILFVKLTILKIKITYFSNKLQTCSKNLYRIS